MAASPATEVEPFLDMEFDSPESALLFYVVCTDRLGFRVRNSKSFTSRIDDSVIMRRFVCSCQGRPTRKDPSDLTKMRRNRASTREGCRAMLQVNYCIVEYCHPLGVHVKPSPGLQKKLDKKPWELLALDTSCWRNKSVMPPFGAFDGVNPRRQLVVFGCMLMTDESEVSFTWLFKTWVTVMNGKSPVSFVTAYDEAVVAAAVRVFPIVRHRFCKLDIFNKSKDKLLDVYAIHALLFKNEIKKCVNECDHVMEFETAWRLLIERFYLEDLLEDGNTIRP